MFLEYSTNYSASQVDELLFREIFKLHGLLETILSDKDSRFMSIFW